MVSTVLVTGAGGQLGRELLACAPSNWQVVALTRDQLDISDAAAVSHSVSSHAPELVINAAAYTAVDRAEEEPELALRINADGPRYLAQSCREAGCRFIHISTDFVFDGSGHSPYTPDAPTAPLGRYGASKLAGEQAVQAALHDAVIVRTAWVYSRFGANFVKTMLRLMGERDSLGVVNDQIGSPTWAAGLARALWQAAKPTTGAGIYHWSDEGRCSWFDFAVAIQEEGAVLGLVPGACVIQPLSTQEYPTPASRPAYSVLSSERSQRDWQQPGAHWRSQLRAMLKDLKENGDA
ncbi:MAG: dTDP-4-dehydrorhamnose reductase [Pseudomonadota bacterium]